MYVITHKHFEYQKLPQGYKPILVGANRNSNPDKFLADNEGNNISDRNPSFCELTGLYWIWKNSDNDRVGLSHYRRYFSKFNAPVFLYINTLIKGRPEPISITDLNKFIDNGFNWVVARPQVGGEGSLWDQFGHFHHIKDMQIIQKIIEKEFPDYLPSFNKVMSQDTASFYNMFYTTKSELDQYAQWLFKILFLAEQEVDISNYDDYQKRLFGFLGERLMNVWLDHRKAKVKYLTEFNSDLVGRKWAARSIKHDTLGW